MICTIFPTFWPVPGFVLPSVAVAMESLLGCAWVVHPPIQYLKQLRASCCHERLRVLPPLCDDSNKNTPVRKPVPGAASAGSDTPDGTSAHTAWVRKEVRFARLDTDTARVEIQGELERLEPPRQII